MDGEESGEELSLDVRRCPDEVCHLGVRGGGADDLAGRDEAVRTRSFCVTCAVRREGGSGGCWGRLGGEHAP